MYLFHDNPALMYPVILLAGAVGYALWRHWLHYYRPPRQAIWLFILLAAPLGIIAGHVAYAIIASMPAEAWPAHFLTIHGWRSGYASVGTAAGALLALAITALILRARLLLLADLFAPLTFIVSALLRVICLINGCCYGLPTRLPWGMCFPSVAAPGQLTPPSHPVQLYALVINVLIYALLPVTIRRLGLKPGSGMLALLCIALYCAQRFVLEFFRLGATSAPVLWGLSFTQLAVLPLMVIAGLAILTQMVFAARRRPA